MTATWEMDAFVLDSEVWGVVVDVSSRRCVARVIPALGDIRGLLGDALRELGGIPDAVLIDSRPGWHGAISAVLAEHCISVRVANRPARKGMAERIAGQLHRERAAQ